MSNETLTFLRHVLPHEGWKVAIAKTDRGMFHRYVATFEEQAQLLEQWSNSGHDTYHACATYREPGSRLKTNVYQIRSLWADIDTRLGKPSAPYADQVEAAKAVGTFCQSASLPSPLLVNSGYGLHVYWVFDAPMTPAEWRLFAVGLKAAATKHGLHIDPARTADEASILRTPGTRNYKHAQ